MSAYKVKLNAGEEFKKAVLFGGFLEHASISTQNNEPKEKFSKPSYQGEASTLILHDNMTHVYVYSS